MEQGSGQSIPAIEAALDKVSEVMLVLKDAKVGNVRLENGALAATNLAQQLFGGKQLAVTPAVCTVVWKRGDRMGQICRKRLPCSYHNKKRTPSGGAKEIVSKELSKASPASAPLQGAEKATAAIEDAQGGVE